MVWLATSRISNIEDVRVRGCFGWHAGFFGPIGSFGPVGMRTNLEVGTDKRFQVIIPRYEVEKFVLLRVYIPQEFVRGVDDIDMTK